jgi:hypothetical protein
VAAIVDEFGKRVKELSANVDDKTVMKAVRHNMPETVRLTEHRLRDAFGVSRSTAKRLAPMVYDSLRDAEPEAKSVDVLEPETEPDHVERAQLQIVLRERITR